MPLTTSFQFYLSDLSKVNRNICYTDTVGDLMSIIGFPEGTECTFIYENCVLDATGVKDVANKDTLLYDILQERTRHGTWEVLSMGKGKELIEIHNRILELEKERIEQEELLRVEEQKNAILIEEAAGYKEDDKRQIEESLEENLRVHKDALEDISKRRARHIIELERLSETFLGQIHGNGIYVEGRVIPERQDELVYYNSKGKKPPGCLDIDLRPLCDKLYKEDYYALRDKYMKKFHDYTIMAHGTLEKTLFVVPDNVTIHTISEFGIASVYDHIGDRILADSVRTQRRLIEKLYSESSAESSGSKVKRVYNPGSIMPEHSLDFRGWWDPIGSGLIPQEVFEIVECFGGITKAVEFDVSVQELKEILEDYNRKYNWTLGLKHCREGADVSRVVSELIENYSRVSEKDFLSGWAAGDDDVKRNGEFWFNLYCHPNGRAKLSELLYWLSEKVGEEKIEVNCCFCRVANYDKWNESLSECLDLDNEIFRGTFLENFNRENVEELSRQRSFSSLEITRDSIIYQMERYKRLKEIEDESDLLRNDKLDDLYESIYNLFVKQQDLKNIQVKEFCNILLFMKLMRERSELIRDDYDDEDIEWSYFGGGHYKKKLKRKTKRKSKKKTKKKRKQRKTKRRK